MTMPKPIPIYYRLHTSTGSLTLRSERFIELHDLILKTPKAVIDLQLGGLGQVKRVTWTANGGDWIVMSKSSVAVAFARCIIGWVEAKHSALSR